MVASSVKSLTEKTYKQINTFVDQKQLDEKKLDLFQRLLEQPVSCNTEVSNL